MKLQQSIKLNYKQSGSGPVVIILHGLFGSLDNWQSISNQLASNFTVYSLDLRNHGKSPHTDSFDLELMANDVYHFILDHNIVNPNLLGHSMGGKVVLQFLNHYNSITDKCIIIDIAPKKYQRGHDLIFNAMFNLKTLNLHSRNEAEELLKPEIPDSMVRQFILKNLSRNKSGTFYWKLNLQSIYNNYDEINKEINFQKPISNEVLFVKGGLSNYILSNDELFIKEYLPNAQFVTIEGAGHWVHADAPELLIKMINQFINNN